MAGPLQFAGAAFVKRGDLQTFATAARIGDAKGKAVPVLQVDEATKGLSDIQAEVTNANLWAPRVPILANRQFVARLKPIR